MYIHVHIYRWVATNHFPSLGTLLCLPAAFRWECPAIPKMPRPTCRRLSVLDPFWGWFKAGSTERRTRFSPFWRRPTLKKERRLRNEEPVTCLEFSDQIELSGHIRSMKRSPGEKTRWRFSVGFPLSHPYFSLVSLWFPWCPFLEFPEKGTIKPGPGRLLGARNHPLPPPLKRMGRIGSEVRTRAPPARSPCRAFAGRRPVNLFQGGHLPQRNGSIWVTWVARVVVIGVCWFALVLGGP